MPGSVASGTLYNTHEFVVLRMGLLF
jgi:hypothetical protein